MFPFDDVIMNSIIIGSGSDLSPVGHQAATWTDMGQLDFAAGQTSAKYYGSAEGPPRVVENRNLLSHPDDLRKEAYLIRMT